MFVRFANVSENRDTLHARFQTSAEIFIHSIRLHIGLHNETSVYVSLSLCATMYISMSVSEVDGIWESPIASH